MSLLHSADHIIALENGHIVEQGNFATLNSNHGYVHSLSIQSKIKSKAPVLVEDKFSAEKPQNATIVQNNELDFKRQQGDFTIYKYYFETIGLFYTVIFFALQVSFAFLNVFPCKTFLNVYYLVEFYY